LVEVLTKLDKFRPNDPISRYEALALTVRLYEYFSRQEIVTSSSTAAFLDMAGFTNVLQKGFDAGLTAGYTTTTGRYFMPKNCVPRHEAISFVEKLIKKLNTLARINVFLEMDVMEGVQFNSTNQWSSFSATAQGNPSIERSLADIYSEVGIDLTIDQPTNAGAVDAFADPRRFLRRVLNRPFTDTELHQLLTQIPSDTTTAIPNGSWHIRSFFVPEYQDVGTLGLIYEAPPAGDGRDAIAIFSNSVNAMAGEKQLNGAIFSKEQAYLRTTAHELGHALNLLHEDGDGVGVVLQNPDGSVKSRKVVKAGTTIMNQTWLLSSNWVYEWNYKSLNHFYSHPLVRLQTKSIYEFGECHDVAGHLLDVQP
jgi:hypothetical protein